MQKSYAVLLRDNFSTCKSMICIPHVTYYINDIEEWKFIFKIINQL